MRKPDLRVLEDILAEFPSLPTDHTRAPETRPAGESTCHAGARTHAPPRTRIATTNSKHKQPVYPNLRCSIMRDAADLTYIRLTTGFVFLAVVLVRGRADIGYAISHLLDTRLCLAALDAAPTIPSGKNATCTASARPASCAI